MILADELSAPHATFNYPIKTLAMMFRFKVGEKRDNFDKNELCMFEDIFRAWSSSKCRVYVLLNASYDS